MKYEIGFVYDFPYEEEVSPEEMNKPGGIVEHRENDKLVARYNVIWSNTKIARGVVTETFYPEEKEIEYYQRVSIELPDDTRELLESGGCLSYEVIFYLEDGFIETTVSGPSRVPPVEEDVNF
jgi:hypothetical protein